MPHHQVASLHAGSANADTSDAKYLNVASPRLTIFSPPTTDELPATFEQSAQLYVWSVSYPSSQPHSYGVTHLIGGGPISGGQDTAQELAISHPDLVTSLQLHCTWGRSDDWFCRMIDSMEVPVLAGDMAMYIRLALLWVSSPSFLNDTPERAEAFECGFLLENPYPPSRSGILGHLHADKIHDTLDRLHSITAPTLVTAGEMDWQVPSRYGRAVCDAIPNADWFCFVGPHSSHIAFHEMADYWNEVTLRWLLSVKS